MGRLAAAVSDGRYLQVKVHFHLHPVELAHLFQPCQEILQTAVGHEISPAVLFSKLEVIFRAFPAENNSINALILFIRVRVVNINF
jgi:hypothetical protein